MPLAVGALLAPPEDDGSGGLVLGPADAPTATWVDPQGVVWPLNQLRDTGIVAMPGVKGLGAAPIAIVADPMPRGGTAARNIQAGPRLITLPLYVEGPDHATFLARWRALMRAFTITRRRGPGTLVISRPDGTQRQIRAYYQDGYDGDPEAGITQDVCALTLYCPDPYWTATTPTLITRAYATPGGSYLSPYPSVSTSQTLGATVAYNPGGIEVWPFWTLTGPFTSFVASNLDTGESWTVDPVAYRGSALVAGETVTVTTDPAAVKGPDGSSWAGALNWPAAVLWGLDEGPTNITFTASGAAVGTSVSASFLARYESA